MPYHNSLRPQTYSSPQHQNYSKSVPLLPAHAVPLIFQFEKHVCTQVFSRPARKWDENHMDPQCNRRCTPYEEHLLDTLALLLMVLVTCSSEVQFPIGTPIVPGSIPGRYIFIF